MPRARNPYGPWYAPPSPRRDAVRNVRAALQLFAFAVKARTLTRCPGSRVAVPTALGEIWLARSCGAVPGPSPNLVSPHFALASIYGYPSELPVSLQRAALSRVQSQSLVSPISRHAFLRARDEFLRWTNSPAWVDGDFPCRLSRRACSIVCRSGIAGPLFRVPGGLQGGYPHGGGAQIGRFLYTPMWLFGF